jgi:hypothetical protein
MLMDRIMGAFTFRKGIYREVEEDASFTGTAWLLVVVVAFLNQLGAKAGAGSITGWLLGAILGTVFTVIGFAVGVLVINFVGRTFFNAEVTFEELVRTLGLAYIWNIIGFIGILAVFSSALACVLAPAILVASILGIVAWFIAVKEALDLDWVGTIVTVVIGWIVMFLITGIATLILGALGLGVSAVMGGLGG